MEPPQGAEPKDTIWEIQKPIYGLRDAAKGWYHTLTDFPVKELGANISEADPAMFYRGNKDHEIKKEKSLTVKIGKDLRKENFQETLTQQRNQSQHGVS